MKSDSFVRILAGLMVLLSLALSRWVHPGWSWFTAFIGLNLIQSAISGFCPPEWLAHRLGWVRRTPRHCATPEL